MLLRVYKTCTDVSAVLLRRKERTRTLPSGFAMCTSAWQTIAEPGDSKERITLANAI